MFVRVRVLFRARVSLLRSECSDSSRRKRQTDDDEQYLNNNFMTQAVNSGINDIEQVSVGFFFHLSVL